MKSKRKKQKKQNRRFTDVRRPLKIVVVLLIIGLNWAGLLAIGKTLAYFNDIESSVGNTYQASLLDFSLTNTDVEEFIGVELGEDIKFISVATKTTGSLDIQYRVYAENMGESNDFCDLLKLEVFNNVISYDGLLLPFDTAITTNFGAWVFEAELPYTATNIPHGEKCNVDLVFKGWREDVVDFNNSGFTDEERIHLRLTSRMIVLNEFLPNPEGIAYGFDFGDDSSTMPRGEWVELYNNSEVSHNLDGWYIWDASGDGSNKIFITDSNTYPATTTISGKSWLVVYMNKEVLDNTGDTVKLFNGEDVLVDSYTYTIDNDYCEIEPTPGDENTTDTFGDCGGVPPNKSYARIPDGIGSWVDPIPTPGGPNRLELFSISDLFVSGGSSGQEEIPIIETIPEPMPEPALEPILETTTSSTEEIIVIQGEPEENVVVELPDIDIIETTTPSDNETVESGIMNQESEDESVSEPEEFEEARPLENSDEEAVRGRNSTEAEEELPVEEEEILEEEPDPEPPLESSEEDQTGQAEPLKEPEPLSTKAPSGAEEGEPEADPSEKENNNDDIENEQNNNEQEENI